MQCVETSSNCKSWPRYHRKGTKKRSARRRLRASHCGTCGMRTTMSRLAMRPPRKSSDLFVEETNPTFAKQDLVYSTNPSMAPAQRPADSDRRASKGKRECTIAQPESLKGGRGLLHVRRLHLEHEIFINPQAAKWHLRRVQHPMPEQQNKANPSS